MKLIKQISTGLTVHREEPHSNKTLGNAAVFTGIDISDLQVADDAITDEQYTTRFLDERPWEVKMIESDQTLMPRWAEDIMDHMDMADVPQQTKDKLSAKKALRATKP